jgi:A/G-specific adenine glycosylase
MPVKEKKIKIKRRWLNYVVVKSNNEVALHQRTRKDIWQQLFEFVLIETGGHCTSEQVLLQLQKQYGIISFELVSSFEESTQKLSHQLIHFNFILIELPKKQKLANFSWVPVPDLNQFAFPKTLKEFVDKQLMAFNQHAGR